MMLGERKLANEEEGHRLKRVCGCVCVFALLLAGLLDPHNIQNTIETERIGDKNIIKILCGWCVCLRVFVCYIL